MNSPNAFLVPARRVLIVLVALATVVGGIAVGFGSHVAFAKGSAVAVDDSLTASYGTPLVVSPPGVTANDSPGYFTTLLSNPTYGRLVGWSLVSPGTFTYTAETRSPGQTDSFRYCLSNATGDPCVSNVAIVTIALNPALAVDDFYEVAVNTLLTIPAPGVLANDQVGSHLTWSVLSFPRHGAFTYAAAGVGGFSYMPTAGFSGLDDATYCLSATYGGGPCVSDPATIHIRVGGPAVSRIGGADRFDVAAAVAEQTHPAGASTVYIASGGNFPDALSAAPAANHSGGALLLVTADAIPGRTQDALTRLAPSKVVIVGGPNTISERVAAALGSMLPGATVSRIGGADRFAVSRAVATTVFGTATQAIVATGANYPDALSSGGAAAIVDEPVVLVNGGLAAADADTVSLFGKLGTTTLVISGGPNSVSTGMEASLRTIATITRVGGADRFEASVNINKASFTTATTAYLATALNYPDALVGGVIAGKNRGPLYVVQTNCVPQATLDDIARIGATNVVLLGGTNSLTERVFNLVPCA